jgi:glycosyltransferase involved in cell wall biosynthesis
VSVPPEGRAAPEPGTGEVIAAVWVPRRPEDFVSTVRRLAQDCRLPVVVGVPCPAALGPLADLGLDRIEAPTAAGFVNQVAALTRAHLLAVSDAVLVPPELLDVALDLLRSDLRVATVSFLSNAASFLRLPEAGAQTRGGRAGEEEPALTRRLRSLSPPQPPAPLPHAAGSAVLVSSVALGAVGPFVDAPSGAFGPALTDFSFRARSRGFVDLLDPSTYYLRPTRAPDPPAPAPDCDPGDGAWLHGRHPDLQSFLHQELTAADSPVNLALAGARVRLAGLRVLVDGSCLGPLEMGTQVATMAVIAALADRPDVREVCVALAGEIPPYARAALDRPRVRAEPVGESPLATFGRVDIAHRPFQPNEGFRVPDWREAAGRVVITMLDLISFHIGSYSGNTDVWLRYRGLIRESVAKADGVVVISDDVRRQVELHHLPVGPDRLFVVPIGTEHVSGLGEARMPDGLAAEGFRGGNFLLCLGTDYSHKNRDLAVRAFAELRRRGHDLALVLAGPPVPWGSSRDLETGAGHQPGVFVFPEVVAAERNWLLQHASLVLYPTSAEGFGLVPFEAAQFGTPTVHVGFGPLADLGRREAVTARDWRPDSLAEAAERLLTDPALADRQIRSCLEAGDAYTWARTAEQLTVVYRKLLARPPVEGGGGSGPR